MKHLFVILFAGLGIFCSQAQNLEHVRFFTQEELGGSARFQALSGAFGALGGDLSSIMVNPAASSVFQHIEFGGNIGFINTNNKANYFGTKTTDDDLQLELNQLGAVIVLENAGSGSWKKLAFGVNAEMKNSFDNSINIQGLNNQHGLDEYFLNYAAGTDFEELRVFDGETISGRYAYLGSNQGFGYQQAFLGFQSYMFDYDADTNSYVSGALYDSVNHNHQYQSRGNHWAIALNFSAQYKDWLILGTNINIHAVELTQHTKMVENGYLNESYLKEVYFENYLSTFGGGVSLQFGAILKPSKSLRIGLNYTTPTWYSLDEELTQYIETINTDEENIRFDRFINPNVVNVYEEYTIKTPAQFRSSIAYVFGKQGLISFDYLRKNYQDSNIGPSNSETFRQINNEIESQWDVGNSYRFGTEWRLGGISLRGGYHMDESPYTNTESFGDLTGFSLGLGFNFGNNTFDIAYVNSERNSKHRLYDVGLTDTAQINSSVSRITLGMNFKF